MCICVCGYNLDIYNIVKATNIWSRFRKSQNQKVTCHFHCLPLKFGRAHARTPQHKWHVKLSTKAINPYFNVNNWTKSFGIKFMIAAVAASAAVITHKLNAVCEWVCEKDMKSEMERQTQCTTWEKNQKPKQPSHRKERQMECWRHEAHKSIGFWKFQASQHARPLARTDDDGATTKQRQQKENE